MKVFRLDPLFADVEAVECFVKELDLVLRSDGFARDGKYWRKRSRELTVMVGLLFSGCIVEITLSVYVQGMDKKPTKKPTHSTAHAGASLGGITKVSSLPGNGIMFPRGEVPAVNKRTATEALLAVRTVAVPILNEILLLSVDGMKKVLQTESISWGMDPALRRRIGA